MLFHLHASLSQPLSPYQRRPSTTLEIFWNLSSRGELVCSHCLFVFIYLYLDHQSESFKPTKVDVTSPTPTFIGVWIVHGPGNGDKTKDNDLHLIKKKKDGISKIQTSHLRRQCELSMCEVEFAHEKRSGLTLSVSFLIPLHCQERIRDFSLSLIYFGAHHFLLSNTWDR